MVTFSYILTVYCSGDAFHCDLSRCIPSHLVCDKYSDCLDESDETDCGRLQIFQSCHQAWEAGYTKSGYYNLGLHIFIHPLNKVAPV